jgi:hypothetical protein
MNGIHVDDFHILASKRANRPLLSFQRPQGAATFCINCIADEGSVHCQDTLVPVVSFIVTPFVGRDDELTPPM